MLTAGGSVGELGEPWPLLALGVSPLGLDDTIGADVLSVGVGSADVMPGIVPSLVESDSEASLGPLEQPVTSQAVTSQMKNVNDMRRADTRLP